MWRGEGKKRSGLRTPSGGGRDVIGDVEGDGGGTGQPRGRVRGEALTGARAITASIYLVLIWPPTLGRPTI